MNSKNDGVVIKLTFTLKMAHCPESDEYEKDRKNIGNVDNIFNAILLLEGRIMLIT